ncbi:MAG: sensor histidine kinase KdpD [Deltaproteobacteria bacterium]|nr:sensor histidine kinase KdpD [Deltaproteobacteria bacterium]
MSPMDASRPDPDELLERVQAQERASRRGRLTVFFGAAPGVGKTYAMLQAAREEASLPGSVLVGVVETHGRAETEALLFGLEVLPRREIDYRGVRLAELDLDAALARRPSLLLVDELAHTNAPGSRHPKRWQDVEEVLDAGIDVYTTLNVQHVESLTDVVARITGVVVRETVPDSVIERAHEVRLVDLPPDELIGRLNEGKVCLGDRAATAAEHFFRKGNLIALREMALRQTAAGVDRQMDEWRRDHGIERVWSPTDRIAVCVSPSPFSAQIVRAASRMAKGLHVPWFAVHVETPEYRRLPDAAKSRLAAHLRLATRLGAEVVVVPGERTAEAVLAFARGRGVTKIVVGKPRINRLRDRFRGSLVDEIVRGSGAIDVLATAGEGEPESVTAGPGGQKRAAAWPYLASAGIMVACATAARLLFGVDNIADSVMVLLLGVVVAALRLGYGPSLLAAGLSALAFDFAFTPPYFSFAMDHAPHVLTFVVMFVVAFVISHLARRARDQAQAAREREQRTAMLYAFTRELARTPGTEALAAVAAGEIAKALDGRVAVFVPDGAGGLRVLHRNRGEKPAGDEAAVARWAWEHERDAGLGTDTLPSTPGLYVPLVGSRGRVGVLAVTPVAPAALQDVSRRRLLDALATQTATAMERALLAEETQQVRLDAEREHLRNTLLGSVSHDLRTPLAGITGAASTLVADADTLPAATRRDLAQSIAEEADRLGRRVRDLLDMTRLESRAVELHREWQPVEEVIGAALAGMEGALAGREVRTAVAPDLPLVPIDAVLIEKALVNLLENAVKYSPPGTPIEVGAAGSQGEVVVWVADRGPGVPTGEESRVFEKFWRSRDAGNASVRAGGVGLGLAVCRAAVELHGGRIRVENLAEGGAAFRFSLPLRGTPPAVPTEDGEGSG